MLALAGAKVEYFAAVSSLNRKFRCDIGAALRVLLQFAGYGARLCSDGIATLERSSRTGGRDPGDARNLAQQHAPKEPDQQQNSQGSEHPDQEPDHSACFLAAIQSQESEGTEHRIRFPFLTSASFEFWPRVGTARPYKKEGRCPGSQVPASGAASNRIVNPLTPSRLLRSILGSSHLGCDGA